VCRIALHFRKSITISTGRARTSAGKGHTTQ
jgi:hypothetical protein